jgi:nucleoside-diphosphate-sugar epimerase
MRHEDPGHGRNRHIGGAAANALRLRGHQVSGFMRPGLVYGNGGSYDIPHLINLARKPGVAPHLGSGGTLDGCVHINELAELFVLAVERAPKGAVRHGVVGELSQRDLAAAVSRMIGAGDRTAGFARYSDRPDPSGSASH